MSRGWMADAADAWEGIRAQPARSGLSLWSIGIGVAVLAVLLGVLSGLRERGRQLVRELGVHAFAVVQTEPPPDPEPAWRPLTERHADLLAANLPGCRVAGVRTASVAAAGRGRRIAVVATGPDLARVRSWRIRGGRFLDPEDLRRRSRVAVVTRALAEREGLRLGGLLMLDRDPYQVVGLLDVEFGLLAAEEAAPPVGLGDASAFIPLGSGAAGAEDRGRDRLDAIFVQTPAGEAYAARLADARRLLAQPDARAAGLSWVTSDSLVARIRALQRTIQVTAGGLSACCLLLGGTTLMSLMVANVRDRVKEIGLRRSLGARRRDIARLFLLEAAMLTSAAGVAGAAAANAGLAMAGGMVPMPVRIGPESTLLPIGTALLLGVVFSFGPARSAARVSPSDALRED